MMAWDLSLRKNERSEFLWQSINKSWICKCGSVLRTDASAFSKHRNDNSPHDSLPKFPNATF